MSPHEDTTDVLQSVWMTSHDHSELDEDCSPSKPCRNMRGITFDGYGESGDDIGAAWRARLEREGKLADSGESLRDLVIGRGE